MERVKFMLIISLLLQAKKQSPTGEAPKNQIKHYSEFSTKEQWNSSIYLLFMGTIPSIPAVPTAVQGKLQR